MHAQIRTRAAIAGFTESDGTLLLLSCGAHHPSLIPKADTLVSILTLCSIPNPRSTIHALLDEVLNPGGTFVYLEHVKSEREDVAWWQAFWNPVWSFVFGGCRMGRETHVWVHEWSGWETREIRKDEDEPEENLFVHRWGVYVKAK